MKIVQNIHIGHLTINTVGTASVVQIGSSGLIRMYAESYDITEAPPVLPAPVVPTLPAVEGPVPTAPSPADVIVQVPEGMATEETPPNGNFFTSPPASGPVF
ncbi:spore germination protein GerPB [Effusibacillus dendaii]|uniref:Uncharacterized protein n=1 Tax=Effusibacillus dendaii TaxID=2743772 RepID=A0A7I8D9A5_9BACL|nr:spore germination protein GerPB [Effusibacillus dendaii]BCJ86665.1 hypothetical protein skT53_16500 [Effusibacillus dendaii]